MQPSSVEEATRIVVSNGTGVVFGIFTDVASAYAAASVYGKVTRTVVREPLELFSEEPLELCSEVSLKSLECMLQRPSMDESFGEVWGDH